ncbi:ribulose-phosphate 3-epimerase [Lactobacillus corticis]|uniref:Ribulose-phosphate 3-epimerase n=1 Tax=Lactobacillus corticis TaxID=2201249 RepID=A0A916VJ72_9LACO|nr:ribulose-phosphate 3-epimerase [Lactobacillus corticis]GFZ27254.1 ribulose-5-phosphate 3-epimerase [Lactobacillus corticis]
MLIAPSILNANNLKLDESIKKALEAGITRFHIDIMDGHFVPNLAYGPQLIKDFKRSYPMIEAEVHLMSDMPKTLVPAFAKAGADLMLLHYEAMDESQLLYWLDYLHSSGIKTGIALNPETPVSVLEKFLDKIDQVLVMTVHPGFGGQGFIQESPEKIAEVKTLLAKTKRRISVEVDGGINDQTAKLCRQAGCDIFVAGSFIFSKGVVKQQLAKLEEAIK